VPDKTMGNKHLELSVMSGRVLGVNVLRGYARLCDLASISQADVFDQRTNPTGTQRDLSVRHAKEAYEYVSSEELAFWPEILLCVRNPQAIKFIADSSGKGTGTLQIGLEAIAADEIAISRVDGNHRLHFADGTHPGFPAVERSVSFCLATGLTREQEIKLFRDINNHQKRMNTSHLDTIKLRLTEEERIKQEDPALYIAQLLADDPNSPLVGKVHKGGAREQARYITLRTLKTGISYLLSQPSKLTDLDDVGAKYKLVRNYFEAVKNWQPSAFENHRQYLLLRGAGLWGICFIGADVIDRVLRRSAFDADSMLEVLKSGRRWNWTRSGDFQGFSGRGGAVKIREMVVSEFQDTSGPSMKELYRQIMSD
jgi:DGQHR domain-containing protein